MGQHVVQSAQTYTRILGILLVLTVVTVAVAQVDLGEAANTFIALAVASVKAYFVGSIFMNLKHSGPLNIGVFLFAVFGLILLYVICMADIVTRMVHTNVL